MTMTSTAGRSGRGHYPGDRPARYRARLGPGRTPLGGGAVRRAAALVPAAADPLGDPRRHPRGLPQPRLRHHLLAPTAEPLTLLGPPRLSGATAGCQPVALSTPASSAKLTAHG